jgi:hypothetical protein
VEIGNAVVDLQFWREGVSTRWDACITKGSVEVQQQTWQPWEIEKSVLKQF